MKPAHLLGLSLLASAACGDGASSTRPRADAAPRADAEPRVDADPAAPDAAGSDAMPLDLGVLWFSGTFAATDAQVGRIAGDAAATATPADVFPSGGEIVNEGDPEVAPVAVRPDGQQLAACIDLDGTTQFDLVTFDPGGGNPTVIQAGTATQGCDRVQYSPDGTKLAVRGDFTTDTVRDIYVVDLDAVAPALVRLGPARAVDALDAQFMVWSADSRYLYLTGEYTTDAHFELWMADTDVASPVATAVVDMTRILSTNMGARGVTAPPVVASGGRVLVKGRLDADNLFKLFSIAADGTGFAQLPNTTRPRTGGGIADVGAIGVSPDGSTLAVAFDDLIATAYEIYVMPSDGSAVATLRTSGTIAAGGEPSFTRPLRFSPDGTQLLFTADYLDGFEPFVIDVEGATGQRRLVTIPGANQEADHVLWQGNDRVVVSMDFAANNETELFGLDAGSTDQAPTLLVDNATDGDIRYFGFAPAPL